jgi:hypothetical protein
VPNTVPRPFGRLVDQVAKKMVETELSADLGSDRLLRGTPVASFYSRNGVALGLKQEVFNRMTPLAVDNKPLVRCAHLPSQMCLARHGCLPYGC